MDITSNVRSWTVRHQILSSVKYRAVRFIFFNVRKWDVYVCLTAVQAYTIISDG